MKKITISVIITAIICITGTSLAAYKLKAEQVSFDKTNTDLNSNNVQEVLDELTTDILSYGDATKDNILEGKKVLVNGKKITGTMVNRGNLNWNPDSNTTYTVPAGYYTGGVLSSNSAYNAGLAAGQTTPSYTVESKSVGVVEVNGTSTATATFSNTVLGIESISMSEGYGRAIKNLSISINGSKVSVSVTATAEPNPRFTIRARVLQS